MSHHNNQVIVSHVNKLQLCNSSYKNYTHASLHRAVQYAVGL